MYIYSIPRRNLQMDFMQLPSQWDMFGHRMSDFRIYQNLSKNGKKVARLCVFYLSNSVCSDKDTHFSKTVTKELCMIVQNQNRLKIKISIASITFGLQKREVSNLSLALAKFSETLKFLWPKVCVLALIAGMPTSSGTQPNTLSQGIFKSVASPPARSLKVQVNIQTHKTTLG